MEFTIGIITFIYNFAIVHYIFGEIGLTACFQLFYGDKRRSRSKASLSFSIKIFLTIGILCYIVIIFFSAFFTIFIPGDIELINFMESKSLPYFSEFFLAGFNILMIAYWQANKCTGKTLAISLARSIFLYPPLLILILPLLFDSKIVWICHSAGEVLTAVTPLFCL
ncbi:hypothetical protein H5996_03870 [Faecalicoccus pleomorphus]|uniref:hypothetical protein n=1 Tax=Faecalicoccus pleomorphus TaxID=1323 RepID=UPI00195F82DE|nr:hypothetical protein [Faecalicoccus pleomorphus]MBM6765045.1 hypothetical protein [Faecalicoccus pleomorphus]